MTHPGLYDKRQLPELVLALMQQIAADLQAGNPDWPYPPRVPRPGVPYPDRPKGQE